MKESRRESEDAASGVCLDAVRSDEKQRQVCGRTSAGVWRRTAPDNWDILLEAMAGLSITLVFYWRRKK